MHDTDFAHEHQALYEKATEIDGIEKLTLTSVGIDIGSSTSHLLFSRLILRREGAGHSAQFKVSEREVLWSSPILLTPYFSKTLIDFDQIREFIHNCYHEAGFSPKHVDTGAVVITGEALKKENARPITEFFARDSGKFICASAGPHHEALLAAYGSGAVQLSKTGQSRILNLDIGGGTTKLSLIVNGAITGTAAINIGARLVAFDREERISRIEDAGAMLARESGEKLAWNEKVAGQVKQTIGEFMGRVLIDVLQNGDAMSPLARQLMITTPLRDYHGLTDIDHIICSGGVSEYIYGTTAAEFGDLGLILGKTLRKFFDSLPRGTLREPSQGIRATVIGASGYTIQVSGVTSLLTTTEILPMFGLKVIHIPYAVGTSFAKVSKAAFEKFDIAGFGRGLAISLSIAGDLEYQSLREIATGLADIAKEDPNCPLVVTIEQDIARVLGKMLVNELKIPNAVISIDGISVGDLDYLDIGKPVSLLDVVPVTVKSLLFSSETGQGPIRDGKRY